MGEANIHKVENSEKKFFAYESDKNISDVSQALVQY